MINVNVDKISLSSMELFVLLAQHINSFHKINNVHSACLTKNFTIQQVANANNAPLKHLLGTWTSV